MIFSPYLQGVPNAKNSYLYSRLMFLQSNAEHIPCLWGKTRKKEGGKTWKEAGGDIKDCLIFCAIYWLVLSQPSHYIMSKIVNKQITTAHQRPQWGSGTHCPVSEVSQPPAEEERKKNIVFIVHLNNIYLFVQRKKKIAWGFIWSIVSGLAKYLWHMSFTGCRGAITVIYDETSHQGISFSKWYTAIHQWIPTCAIFLSNRGHVTAECAGGVVINHW